MRDIVESVYQKLGVADNAAAHDIADSGQPLPDSVFIAVAESLRISVPDQRHIFQLCRRPSAGRMEFTQESRAQPCAGEVVDLAGDLLRECWLSDRITVVFQIVPVMVEHLGHDHILPVGGYWLFIAMPGQLPYLADERGRGKYFQVKYALVPAAAHNLRFTGKRKRLRYQNNRI